MAGNVTIISHSLNAGEVSPRMVARQDQAKYPSCCETMLNWTPLVVGGATLRPGSLFVTECKDVPDHPIKRIRPFVAHRHAAYTMEFGHEYVRFFFNGLPVGAPLELVTPYQDTDLPELFLVQSIDVCYLLHGLYPPHKITRTSDTEFVISEVNFNPPATQEDEPTGAELGMGTLTPTVVTGTAIAFNSQFGGFLAADVGRIVVGLSGRGIISSVIDTDTIGVDIIDDFPNTSPIPADDWRLTLSPQTTLDITDNRTDIGQPVLLTAAIPAFRPADAGKWIAIYGGLLYVQVVISTTVVNALIRSKLEDITTPNPDPSRNWTMEVAAWSSSLGYPTCGCFFQERFWLCNGLTIDGSVTGDYENFAKGANDDSAIARTVSDDDVDAITWIKGDQSLKIGTFSGIYEASPTTQSGALTPSSFKLSPIDANGGARIQPIRVSPVLVYADANKRELRQLAYDFASDKFQSAHLFRLAEHLIDGHFINEMAYAYSPDSTVYVVRDDGVLLALLYEQVESVVAWSRIQTDGDIKSCTVIPRPETGKDWVWWIVERDGGIYVEYLEPDHPNTGREWNELRTDSAVVTTATSAGVVSGLSHLEGKTVWAVGDGCLYNTRRDDRNTIVSTAVVTGGQITLELLDPPTPVSRVEVGLDIEARLVPIEPALPAQAGGPMIARGYAEIGVRIRRALGLTLRAYRVMFEEPGDENIVGEQLVYRKPYHAMDAPVPLQQGKKCVLNLGYDPFARIEVRQSLPFPAEVLNIIGRLHIGDRWDCETYNDAEVFVPVPSSEFGFSSKECGHTCPLGQFAQAIYQGSNNPSGPAIRVSADSGRFSYRGLVALYVPAQEVIGLVLYQGENLSGLGTVITSVAQLLVEGDVLRIEADLDTTTLYRIKVNGTTVISEVVPDADADTASGCVDFIELFAADTITPPVPDTEEPDVIVVKTADEVRTSSAVLANDSQLLVPIGANENWVAHAVIEVTVGSATPDIQLQWAGPAGSAGRYVEVYNIASDSAIGTPNTFGMTTRAIMSFDIIIQNGATPGNLAFQWAQNTSSTDHTTIKKGSAVYAFKQ
jgi:hypothetical protein